jgi:hypothetical protein
MGGGSMVKLHRLAKVNREDVWINKPQNSDEITH